MATYKKGFKKQNSETVLLKIIIGIIVAVFTFVIIAFVYDSSTQWKDYSEYTQITEYADIFDYTNGGDEELEDYVIYFYSNDCVNCANVKNDVLRDGSRLNKDSEMFFIANADEMTDGEAEFDAYLDVLDVVATDYGTPLLLVIVDGEFSEVFIGSSDVVEAIDGIEAGTYAGFNE
ncbi:hypothetical protein RJI07_05105 [Mycoplasmatota bacterium WC30]